MALNSTAIKTAEIERTVSDVVMSIPLKTRLRLRKINRLIACKPNLHLSDKSNLLSYSYTRDTDNLMIV